MFKTLLRPDDQFNHLDDIHMDWLQSHHIKLILLDVNNTLVENNHFNLSASHKEWIDRCLEADITLVLCSNNPSPLVLTFAQTHGVQVIRLSLKPFTWRVKSFLKHYRLTHLKTLVIGDQLFTDVLLGKGLKARTALVKPLSPHDHLLTKLIRKIEARLLTHGDH
jgi:uncharacterized protein